MIEEFVQLCIKHSLPSYFPIIFRILCEDDFSIFKDKIVLEIGGSNIPKEITLQFLGAKKWICVDYLSFYYSSLYKELDKRIYKFRDFRSIDEIEDCIIFDEDACDIPPYFHEQFDLCISINAFEHISNLKCVIDKIYFSLKQGSYLKAAFAPIFSSSRGHHFYINEQLNFHSSPDLIPPWGHLIYSKDSIEKILKKKENEPSLIERILYQIYESPIINRLFYSDYVNIMKSSKFRNIKIYDLWPVEPDAKTYIKLKEKYPEEINFKASGLKINALK